MLLREVSALKRPRRILLMLRPPEKVRADYLVFGLLFLLGAALGHLFGGLVNEAQHRELSDYVLSYARSSYDPRSVPLANVFFSYFRAPVAFFLLGLAACGTWLIPFFMVGQGFLLAYSIHCFGLALGRSGILLAFAAFGIRCLFVLPCVFFLATRSWAASSRLRGGKKTESSGDGKNSFYVLFLCGVALLIGCIVEISLVPRLLSLILSRF